MHTSTPFLPHMTGTTSRMETGLKMTKVVLPAPGAGGFWILATETMGAFLGPSPGLLLLQ